MAMTKCTHCGALHETKEVVVNTPRGAMRVKTCPLAGTRYTHTLVTDETDQAIWGKSPLHGTPFLDQWRTNAAKYMPATEGTETEHERPIKVDLSKVMVTEAEVLSGIMKGLAARRILAWRMNTGALKDESGRLIRFGINGQADITGCLPGGRRLEVECKAPLGKLSVAQRRFGAAITAAGGLYIVARDVDVCMSMIDDAIAQDRPAPDMPF